jgi:hypothetical protein
VIVSPIPGSRPSSPRTSAFSAPQRYLFPPSFPSSSSPSTKFHQPLYFLSLTNCPFFILFVLPARRGGTFIRVMGVATPRAANLNACETLFRKTRIRKSLVLFALQTLTRSVSCKPCICHSYEKCRVYTNSSHSGTQPFAQPAELSAPEIPTFKPSNAPVASRTDLRDLPTFQLLSPYVLSFPLPATFQRSNAQCAFCIPARSLGSRRESRKIPGARAESAGRSNDLFPLFTLCVHFCTVFLHNLPENGMVMSAYHVLHTRHSRFQHRRSPEITWN